MKSTYKVLAAAALVALSAAVSAQTPSLPSGSSAQANEIMTSRLVVKYRNSSDAQVQAAETRMNAMSMRGEHAKPMAQVKTMANGARVYDLGASMTLTDARKVAMALAGSDPAIEYAAPDVPVRIMQALPNDSFVGLQWPLMPVATAAGGSDFVGAWPRSTGANVTVAVIDTGYVSHADLSPNEIAGYDFVTDVVIAGDGDARDADATDPGDYCFSTLSNSSWHGLKVASQIAAVTGNGVGIAGAAPQATVLQIRALGRCGGHLSDVADAIAWAAGAPISGVPANSTPARVINLSLGTDSSIQCLQYMQDAVDTATSRNAVVVVAAGNEGATAVGAPANCAGVIAVGAHTMSGDLASYSNRSSEVTLTAPGGGGCATQTSGCLNTPTVSLGNTGTQSQGAAEFGAYFSGTSSAAPHVSAAVALLLSNNASLTPSQVKTILTSTARPAVAGTFCAANPGTCGAGLLDAKAAVDSMAAPVVTITGPASTVKGSSTVSLTASSTGLAPFTYEWTQVSGPTLTLLSADTATVRFKAPATRAEVELKVKVTSANGLSMADTTYVRVNNAPVIVSSNFVATAGVSFQAPLTALDADGDTVILSLISGPTGARVAGGVLFWPNPTPGTWSVKVQAEDLGGLQGDITDVTVTVAGKDGGSGGGGGGAVSGFSLLGLLFAALTVPALRRKNA